MRGRGKKGKKKLTSFFVCLEAIIVSQQLFDEGIAKVVIKAIKT